MFLLLYISFEYKEEMALNVDAFDFDCLNSFVEHNIFKKITRV